MTSYFYYFAIDVVTNQLYNFYSSEKLDISDYIVKNSRTYQILDWAYV